jgi:hypothetical protein
VLEPSLRCLIGHGFLAEERDPGVIARASLSFPSPGGYQGATPPTTILRLTKGTGRRAAQSTQASLRRG